MLEVLYRISNIVNTTLEPGRVLNRLLQEVVRITRATSGSIAMLDAERGVLNIETAINIPDHVWTRLKLELGVGVTGYVAWSGKTLRLADVRTDSRYVSVRQDVRSELAVPMRLHGRVLGVINVDSVHLDAFTEEDEALLTAVAAQSARIIETARLYGALKDQAKAMESMFSVGTELIAPLPIGTVLSRVVAEGRQVLGAHACMLVEALEGGQELKVRAIEGVANAHDWLQAAPVKAPGSLLAQVFRQRKPLQVKDLRTNQRFRFRNLADTEGLVSLLAVPVAFQGEVGAALVVLTTALRRFSQGEVRLLQMLANQSALAIENARRLERLNLMEESLRRNERFSLLGSLAAEIAHEIRNPITIVHLLLHSMMEDRSQSDATREDLLLVIGKLEKINEIIERTLNLGRTGERAREPMAVNRLVEDLLEFIAHKTVGAGITVRRMLQGELPPVDGDPGALQQVLLNLVLNAVQSMPEGGELLVRTRHLVDRELGPCVAIAVRDTGSGIAPDARERLFDPFYTTRPAGTGLGLFVTEKIIRQHGGSIRVRSTSGRGSTFTVLLPVRSEDQTPATKDQMA